MSGFTLTGGMTLTSGMQLLSGGAAPPPSSAMELVFDLPSGGSVFGFGIFMTEADPTFDITIDWGDGNTTPVTGGTVASTHEYATGGLKTVTITGSAPGGNFGGSGQFNFYLKRINSWGNLGLTSAGGGFLSAQNVEYVAQPNFNNWSGMFLNAGSASFTADITNWNSANVTNMTSMFQNASTFNQNLSGWNVANVTSRNNFDSGATSWQANYKPNFV